MAVSSKRQYEQVASAIAKARLKEAEAIRANRTEFAEAYIQQANRHYDRLVNILCEVYAKDNPAFNDTRFRRATNYAS